MGSGFLTVTASSDPVLGPQGILGLDFKKVGYLQDYLKNSLSLNLIVFNLPEFDSHSNSFRRLV